MFRPPKPVWRACVLVAVVGCAPRSIAQTWSRTIGGTNSEVGHGVVAIDDGGCIISGSTGSFGAGGGDLYLLKLTATGDLAWSRAIGSPSVEAGWRIAAAGDGTLLIAGSTNQGNGGYDGWLVHTDATGQVIDQHIYGGSDWDLLYDVAPLVSGAYAVGQTYSQGIGGDIWLLRLDTAGDTLWTRTLGGAYVDEGRSVRTTPDGGCIIAGTWGVDGSNSDLLVAKFAADGTLEWRTLVGGTTDLDAGFGVAVKADGGYIACGTMLSDVDDQPILLVALLADGSVDWSKTVGGPGMWAAREVRERPDGGIVAVGFTDAFGAGRRDMYLLFTDASGEFEQGRTYGQSENDEAWAFAPTIDGGYVVVGVASGYGPGTNAVLAVKGDANGNVSSSAITIELDPLGMDDLEAPSSSALFPNPALPGTTVSWRSPDLHPTRVTVMDAQGRIVLDEGLSALDPHFRVPQLASGPYRVLLSGREGVLLNAPLLVQP
ncbi:MAG: hypothetical protein QM724_09960 [Flavobacteriales bacterium]